MSKGDILQNSVQKSSFNKLFRSFLPDGELLERPSNIE